MDFFLNFIARHFLSGFFFEKYNTIKLVFTIINITFAAFKIRFIFFILGENF